jgi:hypothetical protein
VTYRSDPAFLVLHALRLKGFAADDVVSAASGLTSAQVTAVLAELAGKDLVRDRHGRLSGWSLTASGRDEHERLVAEEVVVSGCRSEVESAYRAFLAVNPELLSLCSAWQLKGPEGNQTPNDHSDAAYDAGVVDRLHNVDEVAQPICARLERCLERMAPYGGRLRAAVERVDAGQAEWLTRPAMDSYHTVWFELHEDFLVTLGIPRGQEEL